MIVKPHEVSHVLLVEGQDDKHMVGQLCGKRSALFRVERSDHDFSVILKSNSQTFAIHEKDNQSKLLDAIDVEVKVSGRQVLGIVLDADRNLEDCWANLKEHFSRTGVQLPSKPSPIGTIVYEQDYHPRVGIWLMPDNKSQGELEDFALRMISCDDPIWPLSRSYIENIPEGDRKFEAAKADKAKLYAWLAARREPGRMGAAVGSGDFETSGSLCEEFFAWLVKLFG